MASLPALVMMRAEDEKLEATLNGHRWVLLRRLADGSVIARYILEWHQSGVLVVLGLKEKEGEHKVWRELGFEWDSERSCWSRESAHFLRVYVAWIRKVR